MGSIAGGFVKKPAHSKLHVLFEIPFSHSWRLEIALIKYRVVALRKAFAWIIGAPRNERNTQADHCSETIGTEQSGMPGNWSSPIMARDHRRFVAEGIKQPNHIADQVKKCVLVDGPWSIRLTVAAHVGGYGVETCCRQR